MIECSNKWIMTKVLFLTHPSGPIPHLVHLSNFPAHGKNNSRFQMEFNTGCCEVCRMPMVCELPNADDVIRGFQCMFDVIQFD